MLRSTLSDVGHIEVLLRRGNLDGLCDRPTPQSRAMSDLDDYLGRVRALLVSLANCLTPGEQEEVEHLIEHGEPAEAMRALAWIIVEERMMVPAESIAALFDLTSGPSKGKTCQQTLRITLSA